MAEDFVFAGTGLAFARTGGFAFAGVAGFVFAETGFAVALGATRRAGAADFAAIAGFAVRAGFAAVLVAPAATRSALAFARGLASSAFWLFAIRFDPPPDEFAEA